MARPPSKDAASRLTASVVPITRVGEDIITLKDGRFLSLIECQGILFDPFLPQDQQDLLLNAYLQQFIITLDCPVEIVMQPDPVDLRPEIRRWDERDEQGTLPDGIARGFADALRHHQGRMERMAYLFAVAADTPTLARQRGDRLISLLGAVSGDLHPHRCDTDRVIALLSRGFGRDLPAPASYYLRAPSSAATAVLDDDAPATPPTPPAPRRPARRRAASGKAASHAAGATGAPGADSPFSLAPGDPDWPPAVQLADFIQPAAWAEQPNALQLGPDLWARTFTAQLYPSEARNGFLNQMLRVPVPRRFAWHIRPLESAAVVGALQRRIQTHQSSLNAALRQGKPLDPYRQQRYQEAVRLRDLLVANQIRLFALRFLVTIFGSSPDELNAHSRQFLDAAKAGTWTWMPTTFEQAAGFLTTLPLATPKVGQEREIDSDSLALMFPATHFEVLEPGGLYFGVNLVTGGAVQVDLFDEHAWPASHMVVVGGTGAGKSATTKILLTQVLADPQWDVAVIDPSPPIDYERWTRALDGRYLRFAVGSPHRWNLCAIEYPDNATELKPEDARVVSDKIDFLATMLGMIYAERGTLDPELRARVEEAIRAEYDQRGIVDGDLGSLIVPSTMELAPRMKPMPRLTDIARRFKASGHDDLQRLAIALGPFLEGGTTDLFDAPANPDLRDVRLMVYNVEGITRRAEHLLALAYLMVGELVAQRLASGKRHMVVAIDEAHYLFSHTDTAQWVARLYRTARKAHGAVWLLTQKVTDMIGTDKVVVPGAAEALACFANSYLAWLGKQTKREELAVMQEQWGLSDAEVDFLLNADPGEGLWIAQNRFHLVTKAFAPPPLFRLIGTRSDEVAEPPRYPDPLGGRRPLPALIES